MTEKRFYVRIPANMDCVCTFDGDKIEGVITDFSSDGMRIHIDGNEPYEFRIGSTMRVKYATNLELDDSLAPIVIKCNVVVRNMITGSNGDYNYIYRLGCQIENAIDSRNDEQAI